MKKIAAILLILSVGLTGGCGTIKKTKEIIKQDPIHSPENQAYYAQRLLETVVDKLSDAVLNTATAREIAAGIQKALPVTISVSDSLVAARESYILHKANMQAIEDAGNSLTITQLQETAKLLEKMEKATSDADKKRGDMNTQFGAYVNLSVEALQPAIAQ